MASLTTIPVDDLTDDDYERAELLQDHADYIGADDPHYHTLALIQTELASLRRKVGTKRQQVPFLYMQGLSRTQIAKKTNVNYVTVCAALKSEEGKRMMALIQRSNQIEHGPSMQARQHMLWRIAVRNEKTNPRVSLAAVDTLNKQQGVYITEQQHDSELKVVINQFALPDSNANLRVANQQQQIIEGEFTPITIEVPD